MQMQHMEGAGYSSHVRHGRTRARSTEFLQSAAMANAPSSARPSRGADFGHSGSYVLVDTLMRASAT